MRRIHGALLAALALALQCGCVMNPSRLTAPLADDTAEPALGPSVVERGRFEFVGGVRDDFAAPVEPSVPSTELLEFAAAHWPQDVSRPFDEPGTNRALIHTFTGWHYPVRHATLELHLRAEGELSENDSVRLGLVGGSDTVLAFKWWMTIHTVTGTWAPGSETTLVLDLANLPAYSTFPTNILSELRDHSLELLVEDDTAIDYARLIVTPFRGRAEVEALVIR